MKNHGLIVLVLSAVLGFALTAHASLVAIQWSDEKTFEHQAEIPSGGFAEVCGMLTKDQRVVWRFEADAPLDFNIHYHEGVEVTYPARQKNVAIESGELVATVDLPYCWMWTNRQSLPVRLELLLRQQE